MALTIFLVFMWVCIASVADVLFKNAGGFGDLKFFGGLLLYATSAIPAMLAFRRIEFGSVVILWMILSLFVGLLIAVCYYREKFTATTATAAILTVVVIFLIGKNGTG